MLEIDMSKFLDEVGKKYIVKRLSRHLIGTLKFGFTDGSWLITYENGVVTKVEKGSVDDPADIWILATDEQWEKMLEMAPPPFYNSYSSAYFYHGVKSSSNLLSTQYQPLLSELMRQLRYFYNGQEFIEVDPEPKKPDVRFENITGHYVYLNIDGIEYRVYYEESGQGIPFLLQHTAGSDGRQYRHLMTDPEFTKDFRFIAYDLPYHGKSLPPFEFPWWNHEYNLKLEFLLKFLDAFIEALKLDRPAYMGCSMGGHLAPDLAYYRPEKFRAAVGIGAGLTTAQEIVTSDSVNATMEGIRFQNDNPLISNQYVGSSMEGAVPPPPMSSANSRKEVGWMYCQSGPGIFAGDLWYYSFDHNLTGKAQDIDTTKCMLYLLTGTYDPGTPPHTTKMLADQVKGSKMIFMDGVGHFSMSEAYPLFRPYMEEVLKEIKTLK